MPDKLSKQFFEPLSQFDAQLFHYGGRSDSNLLLYTPSTPSTGPPTSAKEGGTSSSILGGSADSRPSPMSMDELRKIWDHGGSSGH